MRKQKFRITLSPATSLPLTNPCYVSTVYTYPPVLSLTPAILLSTSSYAHTNTSILSKYHLLSLLPNFYLNFSRLLSPSHLSTTLTPPRRERKTERERGREREKNDFPRLQNPSAFLGPNLKICLRSACPKSLPSASRRSPQRHQFAGISGDREGGGGGRKRGTESGRE